MRHPLRGYLTTQAEAQAKMNEDGIRRQPGEQTCGYTSLFVFYTC